MQTPDGPGNVKAVDLLRETVRVSLDSDPEHPKTYRCAEILLLRNGKGARNGIDVPPPPPRYVEERREEDAFPASYWTEEEPEPRSRANRNRKPPEPKRESRPAPRKGEPWSKSAAKAPPERAAVPGADAKPRRKPWYRNNRKGRPNR